MWMIDYIDAIKSKFITQYGFPENPDKPGCILGKVPDGEYPMTIDDKNINVRIENGMIRFDKSAEKKK